MRCHTTTEHRLSTVPQRCDTTTEHRLSTVPQRCDTTTEHRLSTVPQRCDTTTEHRLSTVPQRCDTTTEHRLSIVPQRCDTHSTNAVGTSRASPTLTRSYGLPVVDDADEDEDKDDEDDAEFANCDVRKKCTTPTVDNVSQTNTSVQYMNECKRAANESAKHIGIHFHVVLPIGTVMTVDACASVVAMYTNMRTAYQTSGIGTSDCMNATDIFDIFDSAINSTAHHSLRSPYQ